jgi:hypothetical protein
MICAAYSYACKNRRPSVHFHPAYLIWPRETIGGRTLYQRLFAIFTFLKDSSELYHIVKLNEHCCWYHDSLWYTTMKSVHSIYIWMSENGRKGILTWISCEKWELFSAGIFTPYLRKWSTLTLGMAQKFWYVVVCNFSLISTCSLVYAFIVLFKPYVRRAWMCIKWSWFQFDIDFVNIWSCDQSLNTYLGSSAGQKENWNYFLF